MANPLVLSVSLTVRTWVFLVAHEALQSLTPLLLPSHLLLPSPFFSLPEPHRLPWCFSSISGMLLPQGLCSCCSFYLDCSVQCLCGLFPHFLQVFITFLVRPSLTILFNSAPLTSLLLPLTVLCHLLTGYSCYFYCYCCYYASHLLFLAACSLHTTVPGIWWALDDGGRTHEC